MRLAENLKLLVGRQMRVIQVSEATIKFAVTRDHVANGAAHSLWFELAYNLGGISEIWSLDTGDREFRAINMPLNGKGKGRFVLYIDGRILVRGNRELNLRVKRWPILRGGDAPGLSVAVDPPLPRDIEPDPGWWHGGE